MSEHLGLGNLIETEQYRDAVHIAVHPIEAGESLVPGQRIRASHSGETLTAYAGYADEPCDGVVDPFLNSPVNVGEKFWVFLFPGSITSLRHDWTHPVFPSETSKHPIQSESEAWLRDYAKRYRAKYEDMIAGAISGDGYCFGDDDGPPSYRGEGASKEFWRHIEIATGKKFSEKHIDDTYFRCAC